MTIDPASPVPKYAQLREIILDWIAESGLTVDTAVPSERELGTAYGLSRMTVRQTIDQMVNEGKLYRVPGKGTFVARPKIEMPLALASFSEDMHVRGYQPGARDIARRIVAASGNTARLLGIAPGAHVHHIERLRTADGEPMAIERTNLPTELVPGLESRRLSGCSLYQILAEEFGIIFDSGEQTVEAAICDPVDARLLGLSPGSPVLAMQRVSHSKGTRVEFAVSTYRADRYQLHSHIDRHPPGR